MKTNDSEPSSFITVILSDSKDNFIPLLEMELDSVSGKTLERLKHGDPASRLGRFFMTFCASLQSESATKKGNSRGQSTGTPSNGYNFTLSHSQLSHISLLCATLEKRLVYLKQRLIQMEECEPLITSQALQQVDFLQVLVTLALVEICRISRSVSEESSSQTPK